MKQSLKRFIAKHLITGISLDSRQVKPGDLFIALKGQKFSGGDFISQAIEKGALAVLVESSEGINMPEIPALVIPNLAEKIPEIALNFFATPLEQMRFIGVTGTNGKTTTTYWIAQCLEMLGYHCGFIGTLGNGFLDALSPTAHTTPDPIVLYHAIHTLFQQQASHVAIEVSSHGLNQNRIKGLQFETSLFTNFSHDHLDYHHTPENYAAAKEKLFKHYTKKNAIFMLDDALGKAFFEKYQRMGNFACYGTTLDLSIAKRHPQQVASFSGIQTSSEGIEGYFVCPFGQVPFTAPIFGQFNLENLVMIMLTLALEGIALEQIAQTVGKLKPAPGRMARFGGAGLPEVFVDFAHNPEALKGVLQTLRLGLSGKLWCVFGCGGQRDTTKRPKMIEIAENLAEVVIITADNPREETLEDIFHDMLSGAKSPEKIYKQPNRTAAIEFVIENAHFQDRILIAGKGHESYQLIGAEKIPYQDKLVVESALTRRKCHA